MLGAAKAGCQDMSTVIIASTFLGANLCSCSGKALGCAKVLYVKAPPEWEDTAALLWSANLSKYVQFYPLIA
jgi:hypothetical protein